jgi:thiamine-monophosphate kinase
VVDMPSIPFSTPAASLLARAVVRLEALVSGGDDYELLCAIPENQFAAFASEAGSAGIAVASIGTIVGGTQAPKFLDAKGREISLSRHSYSHF